MRRWQKKWQSANKRYAKRCNVEICKEPLSPRYKTQYYSDVEALLTKFKLLHDGKPTNAAVVLFGNNVDAFNRLAKTYYKL